MPVRHDPDLTVKHITGEAWMELVGRTSPETTPMPHSGTDSSCTRPSSAGRACGSVVEPE